MYQVKPFVTPTTKRTLPQPLWLMLLAGTALMTSGVQAAPGRGPMVHLAQVTTGDAIQAPAAADAPNPLAPTTPLANPGPVTPPLETAPTVVTPAPAPEAPTLPPQLPSNLTQAEGREITDVRVVGNRVIPAETILAQVRTQRGAAFSNRQADLDRGRIAQLGFFASVQVQVSPDIENPTKVISTFIVVENRVITGFKFVNNSLMTADDLTKTLQSRAGVVLNSSMVNADVQALQKAYQDKGFAVLVQSAMQDETGVIVFTFQEARVSRIELDGLKKTKPALIRQQIRVKNGDPFDQVALRKDLNRIYDLGFFEDVTFKVDDDPETPGAVIVTFLLKERRTGSLSLGVGFDSRSRLSGFVTLSENNLRGTGKRGLVSIETGSRRNYELSYGDPFVGKNNASYNVAVYSRTIFREPSLVSNLTGTATSNVTYEEQRTGGRVSFNKPLDINREKTLSFGYRNERAKLFERDTDGNTLPLSLSGSGTVSAFSAGFIRDKRDLRLDPSRGGREEIVVEQALKGLGGDTKFTKVDLDLRRYIPVMKGETPNDLPKLVLAGRFVAGRSLNQLPTFEQYYIGGSETVRGYESDQQFGDNQIFGNIELRYRLQKKFQLVGFVDAGKAYGGTFSSDTPTASNPDPKEKRVLYSIGAGVRVQTPIGPIRLDVGRGSDGIRTHFAIGSTF